MVEGALGTPRVRFQFGAKLSPLAHEVLEQARNKVSGELQVDLTDADFLLPLAASQLRLWRTGVLPKV